MKRVLHLIDTAGPGGAESVYLDLVSRLDRHRWTSFASIPTTGWLYDALERRGIQPIVIPSAGRMNVLYLARLVRLIRRLEVDLVQTHLFGASLYGALAGFLCGVPVVCTFHGEPDLTSAERGAFLRFGLLRLAARRVVCVSDSLVASFRRRSGFPGDRVTTIHNGIDSAVFRPGRDHDLRRTLGVGEDEILIGTVGNFRPAKALDVFVRAAALLAIPGKRLRFVIVGQRAEPILSKLDALRQELGLEGNLEFLGFRSDIDRVMRSLDVFVCSSDTEGFSLTTAQAMASGIPVVATRSGGPEELINDGLDGRLVETRAPEQIARAVRELVANPVAARELGANARKRVEARFSTAAMVRRYEDLYERLIR